MAKNSGPTVAKAWVAVIPTTKDAQKNISKELIPELDATGKAGGEKLSGGIGSSLKAGAGKLAGIAKAALAGAGVAAVTKFVHDSVGAFSQFEQLEGGVQAIFGESSAQKVIQNAQRAFSSVQMSANNYLDTVTGFSASLISSLGGDTDKAASLADRAMQSMADNASIMGTSLDSITYAYQGFARGQFTMLDNLKLGYGGTQDEMKRLISDAASMTDVQEKLGVAVDASSMSFDNIIQAIAVVQDRYNMTNNAANEAAKTLEGSTNMMKAAWENMLVAFGTGDSTQIENAMSSLGESIEAYLSNLIPRIGTILLSIVKILPEVGKRFVEKLPEVGKNIMNALADGLRAAGGGPILDAISQVFGEIDVVSMIQIDPATIESVFSTLRQAGETILDIMTKLGAAAYDVIVNLILPYVQTLWNFIQAVVIPGLMNIFEVVKPGFEFVLSMLSQVADWVAKLVASLVDFLGPAIALMFEVAAPVVSGILEGIAEIWSTIFNAVKDIWNTISPFISQLVNDLSVFFSTLGAWIQAVWPVVSRIAGLIGQGIRIVVDTILQMVSGLISGIGHVISGVIGVITSIVKIIYDLLTGNFDALKQDIVGLVSSIGKTIWGVVEIFTAPFRYAFNQIKRLWNSTVGGFGFSIPDFVPVVGGSSFKIPYMATGGDVITAGSAIVGEAGPELLELPRGARVSPLSDSDALQSGDTYSVVVGDVMLSDDDQIRRATREYLEFLAGLAKPGVVTV